MSSGHYCDGCAQAYYKCVCNKPQEKVKEQTIKMNERIRQLAEQATEIVETVGPQSRGGWSSSYARFDREKFAELIIRECIWALWTEECRTSDLASEEYTRGSNKIKEHFGVE